VPLDDHIEVVALEQIETQFEDGESIAGRAATLRGTSSPDDPLGGLGAVYDGDPEQWRRNLVSVLVEHGKQFTDRGRFRAAAAPPDGPAQDGLAYSYGSRDPSVRQKPPTGACTTPVFGVDCSGLMFAIAQAAGVNLVEPIWAEKLADAETWNEALPKSWGLRFREIAPGHYEPGDVLFWSSPEGAHIGLAYTRGADPIVIQSNGSSGTHPRRGRSASDECADNLASWRGPNGVWLHAITAWYHGAQPNRVLRLDTAQPFVLLTSKPGSELEVVVEGGGVCGTTSWTGRHFCSLGERPAGKASLRVRSLKRGTPCFKVSSGGGAKLSGNSQATHCLANDDRHADTFAFDAELSQK